MSKNRFDALDWNAMLFAYPQSPALDIAAYHKILSPDFPAFINKYLSLTIVQRLSEVGLLCGTDWTPLYRNRFYYSRLNHSVGVALIIWHFTRDKAQTLAGLLHDISTPTFSHVADFRRGDALTQEFSESKNAQMIRNDAALCALLAKDGIALSQVADYHQYPIADNEVPRLSADRLEYMFPSGMALEGSWTLEEINTVYGDIVLCKNENGVAELGFATPEIAEHYCEKFCRTGHALQLNENKLTLALLAEIVTRAIALGIITEDDCYKKSEREIIDLFDECVAQTANLRDTTDNGQANATSSKTANIEFIKLYKTFRTMTRVEHTASPLPNCFCVSLDVKKRYINPLVARGADLTNLTNRRNVHLRAAQRLYDISEKAHKIIDDFLSWKDTKYGCVRLAK